MIFATVGTSKYPFPRMVRALDELAAETDERIFIQAGNTLDSYEPEHAEYAEYLSREEYDRFVQECRVFVTHGGTGSVITALSKSKPIVIFPREGDRGEHADDMMLEIAEGWRERAGLTVARTPSALREALLGDDIAVPTYEPPESSLTDAVRDALPRGDHPVVFCPTPPGGHLIQLLELTDGLEEYDIRYLTWQPEITEEIEGVALVDGYHTERLPAPGTLWRMLTTTVQAIRLLVRHRPVAILSAGGGAFVISIAVLGKLGGADLIHVESLTRFENASTTGRILYPFADHFFVQHPDVLDEYGPKAAYRGRVF